MNVLVSHVEAPHDIVGEVPGGSTLYPVSHVYVVVHPYVVHETALDDKVRSDGWPQSKMVVLFIPKAIRDVQ